MRRNIVETLMGAVVLAVAGMFLAFAFASVDIGGKSGYQITADFNRVGGLATGSEVKLSGIRIGTVVSQALDPQTYLARVTMSIDNAVQLPTDSSAAIASEGLLGGNHLELVPGGAAEMIPPGGRITYTQDPVDIVQLLGKFIFSADAGKAAGDAKQ